MLEDIPNFSIDLTGEVALVTGATSGLGRRFAQVLASAGATVIIAGRRRSRLDELAELAREKGWRLVPLELDVADASALRPAIERVGTDVGLITILVNNAGIPDAQLATKMPLSLIDDVISVNLRAPFILSALVAERLIAAKRKGRIINISSMAAFNCGMAGASLYTTTKAAVTRMTEALAVEWARYGINVNAIAPGSFASEMTDGMLQRIGESFVQSFPRKRLGDPSQLDSTLLYLASPSSEFVTGTCIRVDDGQNPR